MAKRDKLYTVNKWNKPFLEEERRKKLFLWGGDSLGIKPGLNEGLAGMRWGYGNTWGSDYVAPVSSLTEQNSIDRAVKDFNQYSNPNYWQNLNRVWVSPTDNTAGSNTTSDKQNITTPDSSSSGLVDTVTKITNSVPGLVESIKSTLQPTPKWHPTLDTDRLSNILDSSVPAATSAAKAAPAFNLTSTATSTLADSLKPSASQYVGLQVSPAAQSIIAKLSQSLADNLMQATKSGGISNLGKAGIGIGASVFGDVGKHFISNGFNTTAGTLIDRIGSTAGGIVSFIPGVGWVAGPAITLASKLLSGVANAAFGSEYRDNGATAYTNWLNNLNTNVDNSQGVNLLASIGAGQQATSRNGWLNHSAERRANETNENQALALEGFRRGINDSFLKNNWLLTQYALNNVTAMGGKLNKCKCNKRPYGGYLDSASPTGFNFLSDLTNIQMQKNQNQGGTAASVGNSFMNTPDMGITFAKGGIMIKPENKGKFTAKAKRHGMGVQQFASYVLAHKDKFPSSTVKQAVFAKNSNTWKKALGGKINYGEDKDIRDNSFFSGPSLYDLGGILQAGGGNWGNVSEINEGGTHEENPYEGVQVGVDPEGTPNLVEEGEVIWNDYVFSNRIKVPKEVCKRLRIGLKKDGFTFADAAKKLLKESKERPNDPISKNGLEANMQLLEDAQEEVKRKMEAEQAVEQFNSLPPEQQVAIMNQEGQRALDAVAQEQMAQEIQNMPPEQQQAIAQQMMAEQAAAQGLGMPQGQPSPEEQAIMQQQMALQQDINPQEAIAQASAMQQQALGGMALGGKLCFGGRKFAEGGELNGEQPTEQADNEMAKYSDEELQDMIDDYQEAESGEVKVTKGKLARLKKKAEKAQAELERRHAEENEEQPQETRQEPSQEELQAAAQTQAMQTLQPIEGQPQEGMPLEGMSPEQAMMMQQQIGGQPQTSPEQMAAMELQQQGNGQYAYGGKLYPEGGPLGKYTPYFPNITMNEFLGQLYDSLTDYHRKEIGKTRDEFIRDNLEITPEELENYEGYLDEMYWAAHPEAKNSNWRFNSEDKAYRTYGSTNFGQAQTTEINKGNKKIDKSYYLNDPVYQLLSEEYKKLNDNELAARLEQVQEYVDYTNYLKKNWDTQDVKDRIGELATRGSIAANNLVEQRNGKWEYKSGVTQKTVQDVIQNQRHDAYDPNAGKNNNKAKNALGLWHFTPGLETARENRYWLKKDDGTYELMTGKPDESKYSLINKNPYNVTSKNKNYSDYYYQVGAGTTDTSTDDTDESRYLTVGWKPKIDYTGLALGVAPGLTGLAVQLGRGAPDMSELDKAVAAYERNTGTMVAPHLTHGLIRPAIIDPRVTENNLNARRLGTNRLLMNTGSTPSRGATILANDANTIGQLGQAMINNWRENRQQEQAAAAFNRETATTNANILNQVDQFNAQTQSALARDAAQLRYNVAKDKIAARDAYYAGLMGNLGSVFKGGYEAWRENQRKNERDLLAASGVFGETNSLIDDWLGISKVDPKTHKVVRGYNTGMYYWINPNTGKAEYLKTPPLATNPINACGGKIKKNKKRKGYTF